MKTTYEALSEQQRWIPVDDQKRPTCQWTDTRNWRTRDQIHGMAGYVITGNHDITIIDFDKCIEGNLEGASGGTLGDTPTQEGEKAGVEKA